MVSLPLGWGLKFSLHTIAPPPSPISDDVLQSDDKLKGSIYSYAAGEIVIGYSRTRVV